MARTLRWPPEIVSGRAVWTTTPDEAVAQIVRLALTSGRSGNPFSPGTGRLEPFDALTAQAVETRLAKIRSRMRELERARRARLEGIDSERSANRIVIRVRYTNLETQQRAQLEASIG